LDALAVGREIGLKSHLIVESEIKIFATFMCRANQGDGRLFSAFELAVVAHAEAAVQKNAERDRLFFAGEEFDMLSDPVVEDREVLRF